MSVVLGDYKSLTLPKLEVSVSDEEVKVQLISLQERVTKSVVVEKAAGDGDEVLIDFAGYMDGELFEGGSGNDYPLVLGSDTFIPGFEDQLIGTKAGSEVDVNVTFPENYPNDMGGKAALFKVTVKEVREQKTPELGDEMAKEYGFETLEAMKEELMKQMLQQREQQIALRQENLIAEQLMEICSCEVPQEKVNEAADNLKQNFEMQLMQSGVSLDMYLTQVQMTREAFEEDAVEKATGMLRTQLILAEVAQAEGIVVEEEDLNAQLSEMSQMYQVTEEEVKNLIGEDGIEMLKTQALSKKAIAYLISIAKEA